MEKNALLRRTKRLRENKIERFHTMEFAMRFQYIFNILHIVQCCRSRFKNSPIHKHFGLPCNVCAWECMSVCVCETIGFIHSFLMRTAFQLMCRRALLRQNKCYT